MEKELEEAAEKFINKYYSGEVYERDIEEAIKFGAKWQAERMYSEEEVKQIIDATLIEYSDFVLADIPEWFEKFKKK